ncbi:hypothetical protein ABZ318_07155 [Streptomyces sp. NPDC006197]|uniref:hypothetical protein n=1 Tax=Streptomyces sp. NPDC006197 TaxID=3156685 RepID=UPI0033AE164D
MFTLSEQEVPETGRFPLLGTPWSIRLGRASRGRTALEVYGEDALLDVVVASALEPSVLRGAHTHVRDGRALTLAWGVLGEGGAAGPPAAVTFARGLLRTTSRDARATAVGGAFWLCVAEGRGHTVSVTHTDGTVERCRVDRGRIGAGG